MKTITANLLRANDACIGQVALFVKTFGESATLTKANMAKALKAGLDVGWMVCLLSISERYEYCKAGEAALDYYYKASAAALPDLYKVISPALLIALRSTP